MLSMIGFIEATWLENVSFETWDIFLINGMKIEKYCFLALINIEIVIQTGLATAEGLAIDWIGNTFIKLLRNRYAQYIFNIFLPLNSYVSIFRNY